MSANERTFQGELFRIINNIISADENIKFTKITQEENVGQKGKARFADGKLYSSTSNRKIVSFELKNSKWDATDDILVNDAALKAMNNGYEYFVTGTPRQLVVFKTFQEGVPLNERKLKVYTISSVRKDDDILLPSYEKEIIAKLKVFLIELSNLIHGVKEVHWDGIDKIFVNKLSAYILEASAHMFNPMYEKIKGDSFFRNKLKEYLQSQDIFNVTTNFDSNDVYNISQLSNYLLYLKIMFYTYLQREVPELNLRVLEIPEDKKLLNKTLRARFDDVLKHDFELIFTKNILDDFEFDANYVSALKANIKQIGNLDFAGLNADIIGAIYNTLIDNQEQHDRGQHFTNTNEVDIVNAFCITPKTKFVLDTGCGAGTFLVRAYLLIKFYHNKLSHQEILERIWGIEIGPFPAFLATMNLSLLDIRCLDNYPVIINNDFANIRNGSTYTGIFLNVQKTFKVKNLGSKRAEVVIPQFDACVGNPPYIRQELILNKEDWSKLIEVEFGLKKINQQSDLYVFYLMHTASFLKVGGRLGYVISASWLDVSFGAGLQKYLLDYFKVIAIIDHQRTRSFETALINTVILILERCDNSEERGLNEIKFVRVYAEYEQLIGSVNESNRIERVKGFSELIEKTTSDYKDEDIDIAVINQASLEKESTFKGRYSNGYWGAKYLRSPLIYKKLVKASSDKMIPLLNVAEVMYGIKTGANDFFYLRDDTSQVLALPEDEYKIIFGHRKSEHRHIWNSCGWYLSELNGGKHFIIERNYIVPLFKSQREAKNLEVDLSQLKYGVLFCNESYTKLLKQKKHIAKYIEFGESKENQVHKRPSIRGREIWYDLTRIASIGSYIFPSKIGERFRLVDNRDAQVLCDKVNYVIKVNDEYSDYQDIIFLILNSTLFRYLLDLFSRQMVVKVSDVDVNLVEKTMIINPIILKNNLTELKAIYHSLKSREQLTIYEEIKQSDRIKLDTIIFNHLGLSDLDVKQLHYEACKYVKDREIKSNSLITTKSKGKLSYDDSLRLIQERFEITPLKRFIKGNEVRRLQIPDGKPSYPKDGLGTENLFGIYNVFFLDGKKQIKVTFDNQKQLELFQFINVDLEVTNMKLDLPVSPKDCQLLLKSLKKEYEANITAIKAWLKQNRSNANPLSIYRDLLF